MDTTDLSHALHEATADLAPRPGFTSAVVRGGQRRRARKRIALATGVTALTALAGTSSYLIWLNPNPGKEIGMGDPRLREPTKGDLAGDTGFVNDAARAWREGLPRSWDADRGVFDDLRGAPHVYWAGNTPSGPTAIVMQEAYLHEHENLSPSDFNRFTTVSGLVARAADGKPTLLMTQYGSVKDTFGPYYLFGKGDRTLLVVDPGTPLWLATAPRQEPGGRIVREWQPLPVTDGVAVFQLPEGTNPDGVKVVGRDAAPAPDDKDFAGMLVPMKASTYLMLQNRKGDVTINGSENITLPLWRGDSRDVVKNVGNPTHVDSPIGIFQSALENAGMLDYGSGGVTNGQWVVMAGLPDGRTAIVTERVVEFQPNILFAVVIGWTGKVESVVAGPKVEPAKPPVAMRLPDGQGWVVANYGATLRYQVGRNGPWQNAGRDAALLPDNASELESTGKDGGITLTQLKP